MDNLNVIVVLLTVHLSCWSYFGDAQESCVDTTVNAQQRGTNTLGRLVNVVVPRYNFSCNGRITGFMASLNQDESFCVNPRIVVWQPVNSQRTIYSFRNSYRLNDDDIVAIGNYHFANVSFTEDDRLDFQSGDVIGYQHRSGPCYTVWSIRTEGYITYSTSESMVDINRANAAIGWQPLIEVFIEIRCDDLSLPANGMMSCSSGRVGVGYEGDTCSFTCNTGYELTGSSERTCQSNGSWSGSLVSCIIIECPSSSLPMNSMLAESCNSTYQSMCELQCQESFNGTGDPSYVCDVLSNGSSVMWMAEGSDVWRCARVQCPSPVNGTLQCPNGATIGVFEDTCTFSCNAGYELQGPDSGTCLIDQSWSGGDPICVALNCSTSPPLNNSQLQSSCDTQYQSTCTTVCVDGYTGVGGSYTCVVTDEDTNSVGWNGSTSCQRVQCPALMNGTLHCPNGATIGVFEDTCTFSCNAGYELQGSNNRTCLANQSWSRGDPICVALNCSTSPPLNNSQLQSSCDTQYQSTCTTVCVDGYTGVGGSYTCVVTDEDTNSVGWSGSTSCQRVQCPTLMNGTLQCSNGATIGVFEDTCTFSCNAGYELQGSNNGTCLANQSWSGGDPICVALNCSDVAMVADDIITSPCDMTYQSQCTVSCDEGFTGDDVTYLCNVTSDSTMVDWVPIGGVGVMCERVQCPAPMNGNLQCPNGATIGVFEDTCTFSCNPGYELQGSNNGTCLANQNWSGGDPICVALNCSTSPPLNNSQLQSSCDTRYQSTCTTVCVDGYTGVGGSYTCVVTDEDTNSVGWSGSTSCQRVPCVSLSDPENGNVTCPSNTTVFRDTCTYYCNRGYQLEGSRQTRCNADGTWSSEPVTCTILKCNDPEVEIANSQSVGVCNVTYGSSCSLNCSSGFSVSGNGEHVCDDVNDEGTSVKWRSVGGAFSCVAAEGFQTGTSTIPIIAGSVGGAVIIFIIPLLLIMILCVRRSRKKKHHIIDNNKLSSSVNMTTIPSYIITKHNIKQEDQYDNVLQSESSVQEKDTIKMDTNPSYGRVPAYNAADYDVTEPGHDVTIETNPSYDKNTKMSEDEIHNTQTAGYLKVIGSTSKEEESVCDVATDDVNINPNPSYESVSSDVKLEDNPS